jgi:glycosyltransferase involved in cell wall biosynthesis/protein-tyrosine-phosphatase
MTPYLRRPSHDTSGQRAIAPLPIRICHVMSADLWAGAEVQVATTAALLVRQPEVVLTAVLFNDGWLAGQLRGLGVETVVVDERRHNGFQIAAFVRRFLIEHQVDIVHTHRCKDTVLGTLAAKSAGVPHLVRTVHGLSEALRGWKRAKLAAYEALDKATLWCFADCVIAVSNQMAATLRRSRYRPRAVTCIHNGINLQDLRATRSPEDVRRALGIRADAVVIGSAGRFAPVKGHEYLIRAAPHVLAAEPRARFLFVGSGPLRGGLMAQAKTLAVDQACVFHDPSLDDRASVYDLIAAMDVFALPSLSEGVPLALLEAMALRRPAVATAVGGVPEVITDRATGLLVAPRDAPALADACLELMRNTSWAHTLGMRARQTVEAQFSHDLSGEALVGLYRDVASASGPAQRLSVVALMCAPVHILLARVRRKLAYAIERRRVGRMRQTPASVTAALRSASSVLIVCHGNIIRSPFAASLLARSLAGSPSVSVASAGLEAERGRPSHPFAVQTAASRGIDLSGHVAAPLAREAVIRADVIFVMDVPQLVALKRRFPAARHKTFLLACLASDQPLEIADPVDGALSVFHRCYEHISQAVKSLEPVFAGGAR